MLIPRSGEDFVDKPLSVLLLGQALLTVAKSLCLTSFCGSGNGSALLLLPVFSRTTTDLIELDILCIVSRPLVCCGFRRV